jgi:hypothetical protein
VHGTVDDTTDRCGRGNCGESWCDRRQMASNDGLGSTSQGVCHGRVAKVRRGFLSSAILVWVIAACASIGLLAAQLLRHQRFFWLLPYPAGWSGLWQLGISLARQAPLVFMAVCVVPAVVGVATVCLAVQAFTNSGRGTGGPSKQESQARA